MSEERQKDDAWLRHAIEHARQVAEKHGDTTCGQEHRRLVGWLEELRDLRAVGHLSRTLDALKKILELAKEGEASDPMSSAGDNCCHIVYACETALSHLPQEPNENAGNAAKMLDALVAVKKLFDGRLMFQQAISACHEKVNRALAAPPRNCDVGSPTKQAERFKRFCDEHTDSGRNPSCGMCPILPVINREETKELCSFYWGQMTCLETDGGGAE